MYIAQAPVRVSLLGGGSDLPEFFETGREGKVIGMSIKKYIYVYANIPHIIDKSIVKYSISETFDKISEIQHPLFRVALQKFWEDEKKIELASFADIRSGTGLGSSSTFAVALVSILKRLNGNIFTPHSLIKEAFNLERKILGEPVGLQDSAFAAYGGCSKFSFKKKEKIEHSTINLEEESISKISKSFFLIFTEKSRNALDSLSHHTKALKDSEKIKNQEYIVSLVDEGKEALENYEFKKLGELILDSYIRKKLLINNGQAQGKINDVEQLLNHQSIWGYKLLGAGGGGFFLVIGKEYDCYNYLKSQNFSPIPIEIDQNGCRIINIVDY